MQENLFPCDGCKALRAKLSLSEILAGDVQSRLNYAEKIIDASLHYVKACPTSKPVLTGSVKEMIFGYNRAYGRVLNG